MKSLIRYTIKLVNARNSVQNRANFIETRKNVSLNFRTLMTCTINNEYGSHTANGNNGKTVGDVFIEWKNIFQFRNVSEPKESIEHILAHVLGSRSVSSVYKNNSKLLSPIEIKQINGYCEKRLKRLPIQYVLEEWDFRDLTLKMTPPVFIPRPETEMLVDIVLDEIDRRKAEQVVEFCCGSGAIAISLLKTRPDLRVTAVDKSKEACQLTRVNAELHDVFDRLEIVHQEITSSSSFNNQDVIVSNPPYIFDDEMANLQPEIKLYEDPAALNGGADGLNVIKNILKASSRLLNSGGKIFLEVDPRHPQLIELWIEESCDDLKLNRVHKDFGGKSRFVEILRK